VSRWSHLSTDFLQYWEKRCVEVLADDGLDVAERTMNDKKPTAGQLQGIELQTNVLHAIRRELDRRGNV
jgi:hypothetical protein